MFKKTSGFALVVSLLLIIGTGCSGSGKTTAPTAGTATAKTDSSSTSARPSRSDDGMKPYKEIITKDAVSDEGLFGIHKIKDKYYYEIPNAMLDREMILVSRIAKTADDIGYGGEKNNTLVVRWQRHEDSILLRTVSYSNTANDSLPVYQAVANSNLEPIVKTFPIKALSEDSSGVVIEVQSLYNTDIPALGLASGRREAYRVRRLDTDRSMILTANSYPENIEFRSLYTYDAAGAPSQSSTSTITLEMNHSMVLLPEEPMMPRLYDRRVPYFSVSTTDYGRPTQKAETRTYATRWRLEPKDPEAYLRGELVEPVKPIVYYIDPATPEEWRPYLKAGVEDWQPAFEAAGFKNAIIAKDPPTKEEDPEFSPEDARYSVIRYFASDVQNAYGPHVHDPRSGEILESDIGWYHNVMNLLRNWFMIQTAAINPDARAVNFKQETMGTLVRFVSAHEVGHTLGLPHNMGASSSYPVDSLRSATFTKKYGVAPSIMDYARFNYVAQPGDEGVSLFPNVGIYDLHSINWGYRWLPNMKSPDDETPMLHSWIREHEDDPMYRYGFSNGVDPSAQTEDIGDDAMLASSYGIKNLKLIMNSLVEWTKEDGKDYEDLEELYGQVLGQWNRYMGHVTTNIGGIYEFNKTYDQAGAVYELVPKEKQKRAVQFLIDQALNTPTWMINEDILTRVESHGTLERLRGAMTNTMNRVLDPNRIGRLLESEAMYGSDAYTAMELMNDLRMGVWSELKSGTPIDPYRRALQRGYVERMEYILNNELPPIPAAFRAFVAPNVDISQSDIPAMVRGQLKTLQNDVRSGARRSRDTMTRLHLEDILERIDEALNPKE